MLKVELLEQLLLIGSILSVITCAFIQKTKFRFKTNHHLTLYSFIVNMIIGILFSMTFTTVTFPTNLWIGLFAFIGADTIYKALEGRLNSYKDKTKSNKKTVIVPKENIIERSDIK